MTDKTHSEQGIWWLNGFWDSGASEYAEDIWKMVHHFIECQIDGPVLYGSKRQVIEEDSDLDEFKSHRILEIMGETCTVVALRKRLKELDIDNNKRMAISEFLLDKFQKTPQELVDSPQGMVDPAKLAAAEEACTKASNALDQASADAEAAAEAVKVSKAAADASAVAKETADAALAKAQEAEAAVKAAEAELQAALDEITALEEAKATLIAKCEKIIEDPDTGAVKRGRAVQEKEQALAEDPLPLRKAKITQNAALKKVTKARKIAEEETAKADAAATAAAEAKVAAEQAAADAEVAKGKADEAKVAAEAAFADAQAQLDELKKGGTGAPMGKLWWMDRVLQEKKKFSK